MRGEHKSTQKRRGGPLACLLPALLGLAWPTAASAAEGSYRLEASPKVCVRLGSESPCDMTLSVEWSGPASDQVCLLLQGSEAALRCWKDAVAGSLELEHASEEDVVLQLVRAESGAVLADAEVKVLSRTLKDSRRRRRHVWSIL